MFGSIGGTELLVIMMIALLIFGPKKLPELGRTIGKGLSEFKRASNDLRRSLEDEINADDERDSALHSKRRIGAPDGDADADSDDGDADADSDDGPTH